jgi:hypothetical protein
VPTFHPAAALRGSARVLDEMRIDFRLVRDTIDGNLAAQDETDVEPPLNSDAESEQLGLFGS